ncbi:dermonecrotic toxin domain-containing protein [Pseudomonas caspiana]
MNDSTTPSTPQTGTHWIGNAWTGLARDLIVFDSLPENFPESLNQRRIADHLQRILNHLGEACEQVDALAAYQTWRARFHAAGEAMRTLLAKPLDSEALLALKPQLVAQRQAALLAQVQLQICEGTLNAADLQRLQYALGLADEPDDDVLHLNVGVGDPDEPTVFSGAMIVTTEQALKTPSFADPALLYVPGEEGGLQKFDSLQALKDRLAFTLSAGEETSLWRHVSETQRAAAMAAPITFVTRVITMKPIHYGVNTQLKALEVPCTQPNSCSSALARDSVESDDEFLPEAPPSRASALLQFDSRVRVGNLGVALDQTRERAIGLIAEQQRTAELVPQLPIWLLNAPLEARQEYATRLAEFHSAAARLESHLAAQLPTFEAFTAQQLNARIKQDLGVYVDADQLIIDLPKSVHRQVDIDPQYGSPLHHKPWKASEARVQSSLSELARQNLDASDENTIARLGMLKLSYSASPQPADLPGVTGDYLLKLIPELDIAGQYRSQLRSVFRLRSPASARDAELMIKPYELQIILDGFCARQRRLLSEAGYALLTQAAQARSTAELSDAGVYISRLVFKPGEALTGERSSRTLQGISVIEHPASGKVLMYLPLVPDGECVIEADSVQDARERLISSLLRLPARVAWLASCVENATEQKAAVSYIQEALRRGFDGFIGVVPALDLLISEQQLHVREDLLFEQSRAVARSNHDLKGENNQRRNRLYLMFFRGVVSFVPGLGALFSVQDGWSDSHASAKALDAGQLDEGLLLAGSTLLSVIDVLLSVIPGVSAASALALVARRATRLRQLGSLGRALPSMSARSRIRNFDGYEADISLSGAVAQSGSDAGTWLKNGELFIHHQGSAYRVYRRSGEQTLRLKKTAAHGYEPPVRQVGEEWVYHSDVGLKGGGRSMIAEILLVEGHGNPAFKRRQARELLDQFDFPSDQQQRMELLIAEHYRKTKTLPTWAEQYRRPPPTQTAPVSTKRKQPDSAQVEPDRRPPQPVAGTSRQAASADAWKGWEKQVDNMAVLDQVSVNPPIYRLDLTHDYDVIRIDQKFYEILPAGGQRRTNTAFIRNPASHSQTRDFAELSEVIRRNPYDQPLMVKYQPATGQWAMEGPLFNRKIETYIAEGRPGFTDTTNLVLAHKLFEMADPSTSRMTATRMINLKSVLNAWRAGEPTHLAQLDDPLLMLNKAHPGNQADNRLRWNIGYESSLETFDRLDFATHHPVTTEWLVRSFSDAGLPGGIQSLRGVMVDVLTRSGYEMLHEQLFVGGREFIAFRRRGYQEVYLLYLRRSSGGRISTLPSGAFRDPLNGDGMVEPLIRNYAAESISHTLEQARQQGKVIKLMGGTNISSQADGGTQVFVIRLPDDIAMNRR